MFKVVGGWWWVAPGIILSSPGTGGRGTLYFPFPFSHSQFPSPSPVPIPSPQSQAQAQSQSQSLDKKPFNDFNKAKSKVCSHKSEV